MRKFIKRLHQRQLGTINVASLLMLGIGMIFIAVGFIIFPVVMEGTDEILESANISTYTGLSQVTEITPLIVLIGFVAAGVITGFFGVKNIVKG